MFNGMRDEEQVERVCERKRERKQKTINGKMKKRAKIERWQNDEIARNSDFVFRTCI